MLGYLRENKEKAQKSGKDGLTKFLRSGLDEYLSDMMITFFIKSN